MCPDTRLNSHFPISFSLGIGVKVEKYAPLVDFEKKQVSLVDKLYNRIFPKTFCKIFKDVDFSWTLDHGNSGVWG